jgi:hypothetical protein
MKYVIKAALFLSLLMVSSVHAAFVNDYQVSNWTKSINSGSINSGGAPGSVTLISSDDWSGGNKNQDFTIAAAANGVVSFSWDYQTTDWNASYDPFGWILNGAFTQITSNWGSNVQSGFFTFSVLAGDVFGFRANSVDSAYGAATATISNFNAPTEVPIPAAIWLLGLPLIGMLGYKNKKSV